MAEEGEWCSQGGVLGCDSVLVASVDSVLASHSLVTICNICFVLGGNSGVHVVLRSIAHLSSSPPLRPVPSSLS